MSARKHSEARGLICFPIILTCDATKLLCDLAGLLCDSTISNYAATRILCAGELLMIIKQSLSFMTPSLLAGTTSLNAAAKVLIIGPKKNINGKPFIGCT